MNKIIIFICILFTTSLGLIFNNSYAAWVIPIPSWEISNVSIDSVSWTPVEMIEKTWISLLKTAKVILQWLLILFVVYIWVQMIISMWSDEEELWKAKRQIYYTLIALIFINIPWTIFNVFYGGSRNAIWSNISAGSFNGDAETQKSIFFDYSLFWNTFFEKIIWFIQVAIFWIAVIMLIIAWIRILTSRWREERIKEWKNKIVWTIIWLLMLTIIELWKQFIFKWKVSDWVDLFKTLTDIALFFAWPIAIVFLTLAWYYYITSNWDEERTKKAKAIIINTILATIILLASYTFLLDLRTL